MHTTETEKFRQKLLALKKDLQALEENSEQAGRPVELDQARVGRLSRMDACSRAKEASRDYAGKMGM